MRAQMVLITKKNEIVNYFSKMLELLQCSSLGNSPMYILTAIVLFLHLQFRHLQP